MTQRFALLPGLLALLPAALWAGAFSFTEQDIPREGGEPQPDLVTHPSGYDGSGGTVVVQVCIVPGTPNAGPMQVAMQNIVDRFNLNVPVSPNLRLGSQNTIPSNSFDFESVALHEIGHCLGLNHPNAASESGLSLADQDATKALPGDDGAFDVDPGNDGVRGSPDDERDDDVNLHYFEIGVNNPFSVPAVIDAMNYSRDLDDLPAGDRFAANGDRTVGEAVYGIEDTEAVMQQGTLNDEVQRALAADDVATFAYARSGLDRLAGTGDDYTVELVYGGISSSPGCDINVAFDSSQTAFAVCQVAAGVSLSQQAAIIGEADAFFDPSFSWFFPNVRIPRPAPDAALVAPGGSTGFVNGGDDSLLDNDTHPANRSLRASSQAFGGPAHGTVSIDPDGGFLYRHNGNAATEDVFVYQVCVLGEADSCAHQRVTVAISAAANEPPNPMDDAFSVAEGERFDAPASLLANDSDPDGDALAITTTPVMAPQFGALVIEPDGRFSYAHDGTENFSDTFVYEVCDDGDPQRCATAMVTAAISEINEAPTAVDDVLPALAEDTPRTISIATALLANDSAGPGEDAQVLALTGTDQVMGGTLAAGASTLTFTPTPEFSGPAGFRYTVRDNGTTDGSADFMTDSAEVSFTVFAVNDPPQVADKQLATVAEDAGPLSFSGMGDLIGPDDTPGPANESTQSLALASVSNAVGGSVSRVGDAVSFSLSPDFNGQASFDFTVVDDGTTNGQSDPRSTTATARFTVSAVNDPPRGGADLLVVDVGGSTQTTFSGADSLLANDADPEGDRLVVAGFTQPAAGTVSIGTGGDFSYTHVGPDPVTDSFSYEVCEADEPTRCDTVTVTVRVGLVSFAACVRGGRQVVVGIPAAIDASIALAGGNGAFGATGLPPSLAIDPATGVISGIPVGADVPGSPYAVVATRGSLQAAFGLVVAATPEVLFFSSFEGRCFGFVD